ncbi:MAG: DUF1926 domain-containing protein [Nitrospinae bacterium]|nr:DUF1926 domain-containing protein [Nitrospinota bacterium]
MNKAYLLFGLHNHQPIGNFEHVFSEAYDKCYLPTLETLARFPSLRYSLHHSGPLLEWLERHKPAYLEKLGAMAKSGQVEILSGGFYEPILSALPEKDAIGQIEMMNRWVEKRWKVRPRGAWLAERIWDPSMPKILASAGIEYTLLDDTHFYYAGLSEKDMFGYWVTEKHGHSLAVFPIDKTMRYSIPFKQPEESLAYFRGVIEKYGTTGITYGDDGEKFGVWPETNEWVFGKKWLERFLTMLAQNTQTVETITYSQYLDRFAPNGRIYLPMASYEEMMHWTLPTATAIEHTKLLHKLEAENRKEEFKKFLRGGLWDNFLAKYDEANRIHKRMLYISRRAEKAAKKMTKAAAKEQMTACLYRGQCNCPYWHGLFGGLYLSNLRHAVFANLIEAGAKADAALYKGKKWVEVERADYLMDRWKEVIVETPELFALLSPSTGGSLAELDFKPALFNLSNVMTRRPEEYHQKILEAAGKSHAGGDEILSIHDRVVFKEPALDQKLVFDNFTRHSFVEHFTAKKTPVDDFRLGKVAGIADFENAAYSVASATGKGNTATVKLACEGHIKSGAADVPVSIEKEYTISGGAVTCVCRITNKGTAALEFSFGMEWNFTLLAADTLDRYITVNNERYRMNHKGETDGVKEWAMTDDYFRFTTSFETSHPVTLLRYPIETVSQSEGGFESNYQGTCFIALQPMRVTGGKTAERTFVLRCKGI